MLFLFYQDLNSFTIKQSEEPVAKIYFKKNIAQRKFIDNEIWEVLTNSSDIYDGDRIRTSKDSEAYTEFNDTGIQIQLREKSMVQIFKNKKERSVELIGGEIFVVNKSPEEKLVIHSGKKEIAVTRASEVKIALPEVSEAVVTGEEEAKTEESTVIVEVVTGKVEITEIPEVKPKNEKSKKIEKTAPEPIVVSAGESVTLLPEVEKPAPLALVETHVAEETPIVEEEALEVEEEETMCQFIFITTMSILSPHVMERKLGYGGPVSHATTKGLKFIRAIVPLGENLNEQALYTLNQMLGQLYFFKGALIDRSYSLESDLALIGNAMALEHADLAQEMIEEVMKDIYLSKIGQLGDLLNKSRWRIMEVLSFVIYQNPQQFQIGVALVGSETKCLPVLTVLRQQLEVNRLVTLEWWDSSQSFDFVISNVYNESYPVPYYYLKGAPNAFDIQQLEEIINEHLTLPQ